MHVVWHLGLHAMVCWHHTVIAAERQACNIIMIVHICGQQQRHPHDHSGVLVTMCCCLAGLCHGGQLPAGRFANVRSNSCQHQICLCNAVIV
jgi:hypothetical protein